MTDWHQRAKFRFLLYCAQSSYVIAMADFFTDTDVITCRKFKFDWSINYAGLGYAIVTRNLTVLAMKRQSFIDRLFKRQKYLPFDSELLIKIIRDDPTELYDRFLLRSEVENMDKSTIFHKKIDWTGLPKKRAIVPIKRTIVPKKNDSSDAKNIDRVEVLSPMNVMYHIRPADIRIEEPKIKKSKVE